VSGDRPASPVLLGEAELPDELQRRRLNERLSAAWIEGAEDDSRRRLGRGLTADELARVHRRYPAYV
jgi:hypothetical protein